MPEYANAALVRSLFAALERRDGPAVQALIAEDAVWRFPGKRGLLAGEHRGREAITRFLTQVMALTNGTFALEVEDVTASDDNAVVLFTGRGERNGKRLHNPTALRIQIRDGAATEFTEFVWDLDHVEEFWA
ncbi:MAG TPA: nuclear transport factor 2 family protein [Dehalococcoidia bacterium]